MPKTNSKPKSSLLFMGAVGGAPSVASSSSGAVKIPSSPLRSQRPQKQTVSNQTSKEELLPSRPITQKIESESKGNKNDDNDNDEDVDDDSSLGDDNFSSDDGSLNDLDNIDDDDLLHEHHEVSENNGRPLSPTSAIAAAFRRLQAKVRRLERVRNEHSLCVDRLSRVEAKAAEVLNESERRAMNAEAAVQSLQKSSSSSLTLLEQQMGSRIRELESALMASKKEVAEGNALLAAARDVFESQAKGEIATARRAWDEGFAAAEKKAAEESAYIRSQHAKVLVAKEAECDKERSSAASMRNEVAMMRGEIAAIKARGASSAATLSGGCSRCKDFDLPRIESANSAGERGPWYSVSEVKNALSNAAGVKLVVLAPTVKVSVAGVEEKIDGGGGEIATLRASMKSEEIFNALERDILPRYAAAFALPGLYSRINEGGGGSGGGGGGDDVIWRKGPEKDKDLEPWLKRLMKSLEESVTEKLKASGGLNVISGEASLA